MEYKDYYKILGVAEDADAAEIKRVYRKLARKFHPDVSKEENAEERFKEVGEAYEVLSDPEKREEYDQLRQMGAFAGDGSFQPPPGWESAANFGGGGFTEADAQAFSDFFESVFGRGGSAHRTYGGTGQQRSFRMRGEDVHFRLALFLEEAYNGGEKEIEFSVPEVDQRGLVTHKRRRLKVRIPRGVAQGQHIRLRGQGAPGVGGGDNGDLFLEIDIAPHPLFSVDGRDIHLNLPVSPWEAALGQTVNVPTLGGKVELKIPAGAQSGQKLRLKGRGLPGSSPGDQYVTLQVVMPPAQTAKSRELFEALAEEVPFNPREKLGRP